MMTVAFYFFRQWIHLRDPILAQPLGSTSAIRHVQVHSCIIDEYESGANAEYFREIMFHHIDLWFLLITFQSVLLVRLVFTVACLLQLPCM